MGLPTAVLTAIEALGFETPSPVQEKAIPALLEGRDILAQAPTGTGKTAAFGLPMIATLDLDQSAPQVLVLTPTRELAMQVCSALTEFAKHLSRVKALAIYGGQSYTLQMNGLKKNPQIIVGTPGRIMDHIERGTLDLGAIRQIVLDEADEMLRMGFVDDVEWIVQHAPETRQTALFSATMPAPIRRISQQYLNDPVKVKIEGQKQDMGQIEQKVWQIRGLHKLDAMTRFLEVEPFDAAIVFTRTKAGAIELADQLRTRGYRTAALHGDMQQKERTRTVDTLKQGRFDILVATDVAARGLDVERITHVFNYDMPNDVESYIHRIGRTGRAGRSGQAILFASHRERRMIANIERTTRVPMSPLELPSVEAVNKVRVEKFKEKLLKAVSREQDLELYLSIVQELQADQELEPMTLAAALAAALQGNSPLLVKKPTKADRTSHFADEDRKGRRGRDNDGKRRGDNPRSHRHRRELGDDQPSSHPAFKDRGRSGKPKGGKREHQAPGVGMARFRMSVGAMDGAEARNIVGAIANEGDIHSRFISNIVIEESCSYVTLPSDLSASTIQTLKRTRVAGKQLQLQAIGGGNDRGNDKGDRSDRGGNGGPKPRLSLGKKPMGGGKSRKSNAHHARNGGRGNSAPGRKAGGFRHG